LRPGARRCALCASRSHRIVGVMHRDRASSGPTSARTARPRPGREPERVVDRDWAGPRSRRTAGRLNVHLTMPLDFEARGYSRSQKCTSTGVKNLLYAPALNRQRRTGQHSLIRSILKCKATLVVLDPLGDDSSRVRAHPWAGPAPAGAERAPALHSRWPILGVGVTTCAWFLTTHPRHHLVLFEFRSGS